MYVKYAIPVLIGLMVEHLKCPRPEGKWKSEMQPNRTQQCEYIILNGRRMWMTSIIRSLKCRYNEKK